MSVVCGILNAYDHRNRGDRAIIETQMAWLSEKLPGAKFRIFSPAWEENTRAFGEKVSVPPPIRTSGDRGKIANVVIPIKEALDAARGLASAGSGNDALERCDAYFLCGGGYLYSSNIPVLSRQLWMHAANALLALNLGRPVMQFPQSWGPVKKVADRWICRRLADRLPVICSRGEASTRLLGEWGFADKTLEVADVVIAMGKLRPDLVRTRPRGDGWLGLAPIDFGFARKRSAEDLSCYLGKLENISAAFVKRGGEGVTLFPQVEVAGSDEDLTVALELGQRLDQRGVRNRVLRDCEWETYFEEVASKSVFLGSRMHACIFAMISGVPTVGLSYQPKFEALFGQLGVPGRCFDIGGFDPRAVADELWEASSEERFREDILDSTNALSDAVLRGLDTCWMRSGCANLVCSDSNGSRG